MKKIFWSGSARFLYLALFAAIFFDKYLQAPTIVPLATLSFGMLLTGKSYISSKEESIGLSAFWSFLAMVSSTFFCVGMGFAVDQTYYGRFKVHTHESAQLLFAVVVALPCMITILNSNWFLFRKVGIFCTEWMDYFFPIKQTSSEETIVMFTTISSTLVTSISIALGALLLPYFVAMPEVSIGIGAGLCAGACMLSVLHVYLQKGFSVALRFALLLLLVISLYIIVTNIKKPGFHQLGFFILDTRAYLDKKRVGEYTREPPKLYEKPIKKSPKKI
jgi:hypothetical protein